MAKEKLRRRMSLLRHKRLRERVCGNTERPRLAVFRSTKHIYAQLIDDTRAHTMVAANSRQPEIMKAATGKKPLEVAALVGAAVAKSALDAGVNRVVFDRGGFKYHGRVKALAESAREAGLEF